MQHKQTEGIETLMKDLSKFEVLIVERDSAFRQLLNLFVSASGCSPTPVSTAAEATELFQDNPQRFALIISNVIMSKSDGWTLAKDLRVLNPELKVILTSGESLDELSRERRLDIPEEIFLRKPFVLASLKETIARVMAEE